ncbi:lysine-sensitive aspartokinase 3, partial [Glaesserella parasuis]|nr:lysine-sensitive aspartokinase 3 [Glaesserella parasuis]
IERHKNFLSAVRTIQYNIIEKLQDPTAVSAEIDALLEHISALALSASLATSAALTDELICHGEMMSTKIFTQLLKERNYPAVWVDVREIVATNNHYGKAAPNDEKTQAQSDAILKPLIAEGKVVITQGFIGRDDEGKTTTLGRGGSDYSAALLAEVLNANDVLIWTDVPGIYTTDPRVVPAAKRIDTMSFNEAAEMATFGAKVLHPATLLPAVRSNIPVYVGSSKAPEQGGTWVTRDPQPRPTFRALALRRNQILLTLSSLSMLHAQGFLANVFAILAKHKISVDVITTSEVSIALTLDKTGSASSGADMLSPELLEELRQYCNVKVENDLALVAIIGNNLHTQAGIAKQLFATLSPYNVRLISYGASTNNVCTLVQNSEADDVIRSLHSALFE